MNPFLLALEIIQAVGAIATAVSVILLLLKFKKRLAISGEILIRNTERYLIRIENNTLYDNEIESITFWKGNPIKTTTTPVLFFCPELSTLGQQINKNTHNVIIPKGVHIEILIPCHDIAIHYEGIGEAVGKLYDTIYILVKDLRENKYCINTHSNIDVFRLGSKSR